MGNSAELSLFDRAAEAALNAIEYPFRHPLRATGTIALGALTLAGAAVGAQVSHMIAEHGGIPWPQRTGVGYEQ